MIRPPASTLAIGQLRPQLYGSRRRSYRWLRGFNAELTAHAGARPSTRGRSGGLRRSERGACGPQVCRCGGSRASDSLPSRCHRTRWLQSVTTCRPGRRPVTFTEHPWSRVFEEPLEICHPITSLAHVQTMVPAHQYVLKMLNGSRRAPSASAARPPTTGSPKPLVRYPH